MSARFDEKRQDELGRARVDELGVNHDKVGKEIWPKEFAEQNMRTRQKINLVDMKQNE